MRDSYYIGPWRQLPEKVVAFEAGLEGPLELGRQTRQEHSWKRKQLEDREE